MKKTKKDKKKKKEDEEPIKTSSPTCKIPTNTCKDMIVWLGNIVPA